MFTILTILLVVVHQSTNYDQRRSYHNGTNCYDDNGKAQRCIPPFENAAFDVLMTATNTCGEQQLQINPYAAVEYCIQTITTRSNKSCDYCRAYEHSSQALTDINSEDKITWWQSDTMYEGIQYPFQVNLTLNLPKAFDITYVRLLFQSPRPESFAIYKRTSKNVSWVPYQFYSATCRDTYSLPDSRVNIIRGEDTRAFCTSEYSDISPLQGGNVAFSTLEGRPSAYNFESSLELQEWVTATDIRIVLDRLNTFGDEVFSDPQVLKSYFYAIADIAIGARCKCNGHASECIKTSEGDRYCLCEHNTAGLDCEECLPFYNDAPWGRASATDAHECKKCDCNGFSDRCYFDYDLFTKTGHGGHCINCSENRAGVHCERCEENYFADPISGKCVSCECDVRGSRSLQCDSRGQCQCKTGVHGMKCDRCKPNHFDLQSEHGCKSCDCYLPGSMNISSTNCDSVSGDCFCKQNVEGKQCHDCKPGYFNIDERDEAGCSPCFCYGHSSECYIAPGYSRALIDSRFLRNREKWTIFDKYGGILNDDAVQYNLQTQSINIRPNATITNQYLYFSAPDKFLGDKRFSYNRMFRFSLYFDQVMVGSPAVEVILEGAKGDFKVSTMIPSQGINKTDLYKQKFEFRLNENYWQPRLPFITFMAILSNLTAIHIRALYPQSSVITYLDDVQLETAQRTGSIITDHQLSATWIERCTCPKGYVGQFCESCAPGFRHVFDPIQDTSAVVVHKRVSKSFQSCVPCVCNGHADICDSETGQCICHHNTMGDNCDQCARGYYGNARLGTENDCKSCQCPNNAPCMQLSEHDIICLECPLGYAGPRCNICADGYFGDPTGAITGQQKPCQLCDCNDNIDKNAIGNCNRTTGECLKCIYNTGGVHCEHCLPGFYGEALAGANDCKPCNCHEIGTERDSDGLTLCHPVTGQCKCLINVKNQQCDECMPGFYNLMSGNGCQTCNCNSTGTKHNTVCDSVTGQCECWSGIVGQTCNLCNHYHYGFESEIGCKPCNCDLIGSQELQCDVFSGQCKCIDNVEGQHCNKCKENKYDRQRGCLDCPDCYKLVQKAVHNHTQNLDQLENILMTIGTNPLTDNAEDIPEFENELRIVQIDTKELLEAANKVSDKEDISSKIVDTKSKLDKIEADLTLIDNGLASIHLENSVDTNALNKKIDQTRDEIRIANDQLRTEGANVIEKAKEKINSLGQRNDQMTEISQQASKLVENLQENLTRIQELAQQAKNVSFEAYEILKEATQLQKNATDEAQNFDYKLLEFDRQISETDEQIEKLRNQILDVNRKALETFKEAKELTIPESLLRQSDFSLINEDREKSEREAYRILSETDKLLDTMADLRQTINTSLVKADEILDNVRDQQESMDELLSDVDASNNRADDAIKMCNKTLLDAEKTYNTLSEFDKEVHKNKELAKTAMEQLPEIEQMIETVKAKTKQAENSVDSSKKNAEEASLIAVEVQEKLMDPMLNETKKLEEMTISMKQKSRSLHDETESLPVRLNNTAMLLDQFEKQIESNNSLITKAKQKVSQAESSTIDANRKVTKTLSELEAIEKELASVPTLTDNDLDRLTEKLKALEDELSKINLDQRLDSLMNTRSVQLNQIKSYEQQLNTLENQVKNVEEIMSALPDSCFKEQSLEI